MPFRDRTGPLGQGPMTGRGRGLCAGPAVPGNMNPGSGRGMGRCSRGGQGRGWRHQFNATGLPGWQRTSATATGATPTPFAKALPEQEITALKSQAESLQTTLN
jgi:hypothetical protein